MQEEVQAHKNDGVPHHQIAYLHSGCSDGTLGILMPWNGQLLLPTCLRSMQANFSPSSLTLKHAYQIADPIFEATPTIRGFYVSEESC